MSLVKQLTYLPKKIIAFLSASKTLIDLGVYTYGHERKAAQQRKRKQVKKYKGELEIEVEQKTINLSSINRRLICLLPLGFYAVGLDL